MKRFNGRCLLALAAASAAYGGNSETARELEAMTTQVAGAVRARSAHAGLRSGLERSPRTGVASVIYGANAVWGSSAAWGPFHLPCGTNAAWRAAGGREFNAVWGSAIAGPRSASRCPVHGDLA